MALVVSVVLISFLVPIHSSLVEDEIVGALVGRVYVEDNYQLQSMLNNLQPPGDQEANRGVGFLVNESNQIAQFYVHPFTLAGLQRSAEAQAHIERLTKTGFGRVEQWFQCLAFSSFLAIRN